MRKQRYEVTFTVGTLRVRASSALHAVYKAYERRVARGMLGRVIDVEVLKGDGRSDDG